MAGDTWVALDGRVSGAYFGTCWISDTGLYVGPNPAVPLTGSAWVPGDANTVEYLICAPNPDADDTHVLNGAYTATDYDQSYFSVGGTDEFGDPTALDSGAHLFLVWFQSGLSRTADPALLVTPSASPLDLAPIGWVSGGRLAPSPLPPGGPRPAAAIYDETNTLLSALPLADGIQWQRQPNVPGWLSMRLPLKDSATDLATGGRFLKVFWRGQCVQAAQIGHTTVELGADGNLWRVFDQQVGVADLLSGMVVLPEYGMDRVSTQGQRWFGWMSGPGAWRATGNWTTSEATTWATMTGSRTGKPEGLDFPNPSWIAKNDPLFPEAIGQLQFSYLDFTTASNIPYQILATGDNWLWLALDGEVLITPDAQDGQTWRFLVQVTGNLPAGGHTLAGKVLNGGLTAPSPMGLLVTLQEMQSNGDVVVAPPVVNTDASWVTSDIVPGFKRADVLAQVFGEAADRFARGTALLTLGYTFTDDSYGDAWLDTPGEYALDVNSTILDAITVLTDDDLDVDVDPDTFTVNAYNRLGHDLFSTVKVDLGRDNGGIDTHHVDRVEPKFNTAYVQIADGRFVKVEDAASVAEYGPIEGGLSLGNVADKATAERLAAVQFKENAYPSLTFTTKLSSLTGPQLYVDFNVGDSIGVPDEAGTGYVKVRVVSVTVDATGEVPVITPELVLDPS